MKVAIIGSGYVGLTTGVCLSFVGHEVTCVDVDPQRVSTLKSGAVPFHEPYLAEMMRLVKLQYTSDYAQAIPDAEVIFIAVGTPSRPDGSPNLEYLDSAARSIGHHLGKEYTVVVNKSTVPIGSGNWVESIVRDAFRGRNNGHRPENFSVASNPEFLREGSAIHDSLYPDRVVIGADQQLALERLYSLYRPLLDQSFSAPPFLPRPDDFGAVPLISADLASAELIKYAANAFLALKISYINEVGQLAQRVGADVQLVARGMGLDARIGTRFLQAGIGWGGSCFGKDTAALVSTAAEYQLEMPIVQAARKINTRQRELVVERLLGAMKLLKGKTVGLLGLAFKPNTDDLRDAPALDIARRLIERGARVRAHDPVAVVLAQKQNPDLAITWCSSALETADEADALVLVTDWPEYRELDWKVFAEHMRNPLILDGRHFLDAAQLQALGFQYLAV
jgi:UDPglucose 6-dehydrogenase